MNTIITITITIAMLLRVKVTHHAQPAVQELRVKAVPRGLATHLGEVDLPRGVEGQAVEVGDGVGAPDLWLVFFLFVVSVYGIDSSCSSFLFSFSIYLFFGVGAPDPGGGGLREELRDGHAHQVEAVVLLCNIQYIIIMNSSISLSLYMYVYIYIYIYAYITTTTTTNHTLYPIKYELT